MVLLCWQGVDLDQELPKVGASGPSCSRKVAIKELKLGSRKGCRV